MSSPAIVAARGGDEERLLPLYGWLFEPPGYAPSAWAKERALKALSEAVRSPQSTVLMAVDGEEVVGIVVAYLDINSVRFGQRCWVEDLAVHPERRSAGIGTALLDQAERWAREHGATHLELDTGEARSDAQRFYERRGPIHRGISYSWALGR